MEVQLSASQAELAQLAVAAGRLTNENDAVAEALELWEDRERQRLAFVASLDAATERCLRGEGRVITEQSVRDLASEVKTRGRARLLAELANIR